MVGVARVWGGYRVGMGYHFRGQEQAVPEEILQWADPEIWRLAKLVEQIDMSGFLGDYCDDGWGGQPYDPRLMLVSVWWCYQHGTRGPQDIARACREQVSLRVLWARARTPSSATFRRFIGGHSEGWRRVQASSVACCARLGLVDMSVTATDSTPIAAPVALSTVMSAARLTVLIDQTAQDLHEVRRRAAEAADQGMVDDCCQRLRREEMRLPHRLGRLRAAEDLARTRTEEIHDDHPPPERVWARHVADHQQGLTEMIAKQQEAVDAYQAKVTAGDPPRARHPEPHGTIPISGPRSRPWPNVRRNWPRPPPRRPANAEPPGSPRPIPTAGSSKAKTPSCGYWGACSRSPSV